MDVNDICMNCSSYAELILKDRNGKPDYENKKHCCLMFESIGRVYETTGDERCEMFTERRESW